MILHTTDGGLNWDQQEQITPVHLRSINFIDGNIGWAVGDSGTILNTQDGGMTWLPQTSGVEARLTSIHFIDENAGWVVGREGVILHTANGGTDWNVQASGTNRNLLSVNFNDSNTGWVVGSYGTILKTTDGGVTWYPQLSGTNFSLYSVQFVDSNIGWIVGRHGTILKTVNGGLSFIEPNSHSPLHAENLLSQNYPNPFDRTTSISYSVPESSLVTLKVYDLYGREVETIVDEYQKEDDYTVDFDSGALQKGIYIYHISLGNYSETKKMLIIR